MNELRKEVVLRREGSLDTRVDIGDILEIKIKWPASRHGNHKAKRLGPLREIESMCRSLLFEVLNTPYDERWKNTFA